LTETVIVSVAAGSEHPSGRGRLGTRDVDGTALLQHARDAAGRTRAQEERL